MKKPLPYLFFICSLLSIHGQINQRIEVKGTVLSDNQDVENVTVFNKSSNKGIITNERGEFVLEVTLNDHIEISALQFEPLIIIVDAAVMETKQLKVYLREHVNNLDAVVLTYGLTGNLETDITNVKPQPSIEINFGNMNAYELDNDKAFDNQVVLDALNSVMNKGQLNNGVNFAGIIGVLFSAINKPKKKRLNSEVTQTFKKPKEITDVFTRQYISNNLDMQLEDVEEFLAFIDSLGYDSKLLYKGNEMQLLEFLVQQGKLFLKEYNVKN